MNRLVWLGSVVWPKLLRSHRLGRRQIITRLVFFLAGCAIAVGIYAIAQWFLNLCYHVEAVGPLICRRLLDLMLAVLLSVLLLSNIVTSLSSFFLADDLELLIAAPVPPRTLFGARFAEQVLHSSWMVLAFGLPALLAFAKAAGGISTYLAIAAVLPPLLIFPAAAGLIISLLLVSYFPAARVRDLVVALLFVGFMVIYLFLRLMEPERFLNPDGFASLVNLLASLSTPAGSWLPSHWGTRVIVSTFRDTSATTQSWLLLLAALWSGAGASYVVASALFRRLYPLAYSRSQEGRKVARISRIWAWIRRQPLPDDGRIRAPGRRAPGVDLVRVMGNLVSRGATREFLIKDVKLLLRDASQWSQLVLLLALVFVYLYNFRHFKQLSESGLIGRMALYMVGMGLSAFVTTAVSVRFAFPLVSLEGRMLWLLGSAPLRPRQVLWSKLFATLPPLLVVSEVLAVASSIILGAPAPIILLGALVAALIAASVASLSVGLGAMLPDYQAESAAKVAASFGGLVCMCLAMVVALTIVGLAIYPAYSICTFARVHVSRLVWCGVGAMLVGVTSVAVPLWLGTRALERHEV